MTNLAIYDEEKYYYDAAAADRVVNFIQRFCTHIKGDLAGKPLILEDWQKDEIIRPAFGWKRKSDHKRKHQTLYVELPRKNAKSTLSSGLALYLLCADREKGGEIYSAAGDREQARLVFEPAKAMILNSKRLSKTLKPYKYSIVHTKSNSFYKVISADAHTKHGFNAHGIIFDELHVQPNRELWDVLTTSVGAREQPMTIAITTAGVQGSFGEEMHDYAKKVHDGIIEDDSFLAVIYAADQDDDPFLEETWRKANPGFGTIIKKKYFEQQARRAKNEPSFLNTFKQLHLNIWTNSSIAWVPDHVWRKCNLYPISSEKLAGRTCFGGLDLASTRDLTAFTLLFPPTDPGGIFEIICYFFCPEETVFQRTKSENVNYQAWCDQGLMIATPGNSTDYTYVKKVILEAAEKYNLQAIGVDRYNSSQLVTELLDEGLTLNPYPMSYTGMSTPSKEFERFVYDQKINHGGNPVLRWQVNNVVMDISAEGNIKPNKKKAKEKIDGVVSTIISIGQYLISLSDEGYIYNTRGIRSI